MQAERSSLEGGFAQPVFDAQAVFRAVMDAMARPGSVHAIGERATPPSPLLPATAAVALALCDH
ncbi:MAG: phosphonate C-P lyase system protein PhnH, partial [Rhizobiaceae bacterium]|nr:phosphonate C-P lyase system protein PhnH [Rhizobiaceae bacterium]